MRTREIENANTALARKLQTFHTKGLEEKMPKRLPLLESNRNMTNTFKMPAGGYSMELTCLSKPVRVAVIWRDLDSRDIHEVWKETLQPGEKLLKKLPFASLGETKSICFEVDVDDHGVSRHS